MPSPTRIIDLAADRLREDWKKFRAGQGQRPDIRAVFDAYLPQLPVDVDTHRSELLAALVAVDIDQRKLAGETPQPADYHALFPGEWQTVPGSLADADPFATTGSWEKSPTAARAGSEEPRFLRKERLGEGTFGEVFRCEDRKLQREVAVKWFKPGVVGPPPCLQLQPNPAPSVCSADCIDRPRLRRPPQRSSVSLAGITA